MNKIKAAIIEDEIPAGRLLHKMLSGLRPDWDIVVLPGSIEGSVKWFQEHPHPDIIFLDIQLTDGISFAFIEQAQPESMIIFTTAYDEYAIRAFTVNSIDYLLKPINRERLAEAIEKFERLTARYGNTTLSNPSNELLNLLKNISNPEKKYRTRFLISGDEKLYTLQVEDIAYFSVSYSGYRTSRKNCCCSISAFFLRKLSSGICSSTLAFTILSLVLESTFRLSVLMFEV